MWNTTDRTRKQSFVQQQQPDWLALADCPHRLAGKLFSSHRWSLSEVEKIGSAVKRYSGVMVRMPPALEDSDSSNLRLPTNGFQRSPQ